MIEGERSMGGERGVGGARIEGKRNNGILKW